MRCGNIGTERSKEFQNTQCRVCGEEEENSEHVWKYREARNYMKEEWGRVIEEKGLLEVGEDYRKNLVGLLKDDPIVEICLYIKKI